ncbi:MAG: glycosyltransferase family 4 protein [Eggerthellaceae bacterium]
MGGVEKYTGNLARELAALGNDVIIVTNNTDGAPEREHEGRVRIFRLPCANAMGGRFPITWKGTQAAGVWKELRKSGIDRVIVNTRFYPLSLLGIRFAHELGRTPILIDHGSAHLTVGSPLADIAIQAVEHAMTFLAKRRPFRCFCVSAKSLAWVRHFGIEGEGVLNNSIDARAFRGSASQRDFRAQLGLDGDTFLVAFTGRLAPEKGVAQLAEAARLLDGSKVHMLLAGDGVLRDQLESDKSPNLHLLGPLSPEDVAALLLQCDAFCMPTRSEGFSTSLLEAASCSLALITTDVGGVDELVPSPEYGRVIPSADPQVIAQTIRELANDRGLCRTIGENARQRTEELFTWKKTAQKVEAAFEGR